MPLTTDREKGAHLLRRFGLGASEAELDFYLKDGFDSCIDTLLNYDAIDEGFTLDPETLTNKNGQLNAQAISIWWATRMLVTRRPVQEKMTLFWHDHFATSASKVQSGRQLLAQNEILRANATGNFRTLLREVSKDPAMLFWLDNEFNVKGKPNENFAREVMELFTLGIGNYTEHDIQEAARAFTGWSLARPNGRTIDPAKAKKGAATFVFRPALHDTGQKTVLGKSGNFTGDDIIDILCDLPRTAWYITWKLWEWFAYDDPDKALIDRLSARFHQSNLNIKLLLRDIMKSPEFYSEKAERKIYKNPVDFCIATMRQIGIGQMVAQQLQTAADKVGPARLGPSQVARVKMKGMGMEILYPPDVAGWDTGPAWVTSATMVERIGWADVLFGGGGTAGKVRYSLRYPAYGLFTDNPTPKGVVEKLMSVYDVSLPPNKVQTILNAATRVAGGTVTPQNASETALVASKLIFASPEFQFS